MVLMVIMVIMDIMVILVIMVIMVIMVIKVIIITRPRPAFGRQGLGGWLGGYSSNGYTSHASLRACGAQLGGKSTCQ